MDTKTHTKPADNASQSDADVEEKETKMQEDTQTKQTEEPVLDAAQNDAVEEEKKEPADNASQSDADVEEKQEETAKSASDAGKWYIIHTYAGHENKVERSLKQRVESMKFTDRVFDIIVPTRNTIKVSQGKKETVKEKIFPGYVLVKMILDDETWIMVRSTPGVTSFIGAGNKPTPISDKEVEAIQKFMKLEEPMYKVQFSVGEAVKITDGPFTEFLGTIESIDEARGKVKVLVSIFGRETPVELDFLQVKKI